MQNSPFMGHGYNIDYDDVHRPARQISPISTLPRDTWNLRFPDVDLLIPNKICAMIAPVADVRNAIAVRVVCFCIRAP